MREINEQIHKGTLVHVRNRVGKRVREEVSKEVCEGGHWQVWRQVIRIYLPIRQNLNP